MKRILIALLLLLWLIPQAQAVPAYPGTYKYKQPDGTVIVLQNHGDEFFNWITDASGRIVEKDADGFYRPVDPAVSARRAQTARTQARTRRATELSLAAPRATNFGEQKILCILAEFQPEKDSEGNELFSGKYVLTDPQQHFWDMLNKPNYDYDGAIGSVKDYFVENSLGHYEPQFDVYGPVLLSESSSYYDNGGEHKAILEAYELLKDQIDIDQYDGDNNGQVDMVLFYYPGHNQAEQAPEWTIWPHQSTGLFGEMGGKQFVRYFCTSELRGKEGNEAAAIGTTCHEFAHSLGLPDFYDTDYEDNGENGFTTGFFDLMASGNYNDRGRIPPYLSALERQMLGWMEVPQAIGMAGSYTLQGVQNNQAFRIDGQTSGEYFILECRDGNGWDGYLKALGATGLAVYHIDQTENVVPGSGQTAAYLWNRGNAINAYGGHPCYYLVSAVNEPENNTDYLFPGRMSVTSLALTDWSGESTGMLLNNIAFNNDKVTFGTNLSTSRTIYGRVTNLDGNPVQGATVVLSKSTYAFSAPEILSTDQVCETDANGDYMFSLADDASEFQVISVRKEGFVSQACNLLISGIFSQKNFVMLLLGQDPPASLKKYDGNTGTMVNYRINGLEKCAVAMRYTAEELADMGAIGATISDVSFLLGAENGESIYVIVDIGEERSVFRVDSGYTPNDYTTINLSGEGLTIPAGKDVYIGVGIDPIVEDSHPFRLYRMPAFNDGFYFLTSWEGNEAWRNGSSLSSNPRSVVVSASLAMVAEIDFATLDISYIKLVDGVPQVVPAAGKTVHAVTWTLDGTAVNGTPPAVETLSAGAHTYMARLEFYDGTAERVYYDVTKE